MKFGFWESLRLLGFIVKCFFLFTVGLFVFDEGKIYNTYTSWQNKLLGEN